MKRIKLTQGKYAIVDDIDYDYLMQWKWWAHKCEHDKTFYATGYIKRENGKEIDIQMHRAIGKRMNIKNPDHINRNGLDNRRENLREATKSQQQWNQDKPKNNTSGYKGVSRNIRCKKWQAYIKFNKKQIHLGYFTNKKKAAHAYDFAAIKYFGEFAVLNFPIVSRRNYLITD